MTVKKNKEEKKNGVIFHVHQRKTQYCQDVSSFQLDLQIQCNPNQNPSKLFWGYHHIESKVLGEAKDPE